MVLPPALPRRLPRVVVSAVMVMAVSLGLSGAASAAGEQLEFLTRGVVAVRGVDNSKNGSLTSSQAYVGWRLLATDPADITFNVYRSANGGAAAKLNPSPISTSTNYVDTSASFSQTNVYTVIKLIGGVEQPAEPGASFTIAANAPAQNYFTLPLQRPTQGADTLPDGSSYTYSPGDSSAADLDGNGDYEIILKWDPSNGKDNSQSGYTGKVYLDAYKMDGTLLWRVDLGFNVRAGAHYTQFMVYDFDGDGRAEVMCRTAPGAKDGQGNFVADPAKWQNAGGPARPSVNHSTDYRNSGGYILSGPEFLTIFDGLTGAELVSTNYIPFRDPDTNNHSPSTSTINSIWGDNYGNRIDRFLAGVAYLDGERPSAVMCRGYYTRTFLVAYDWRDGALTRRWIFDSNTYGGGVYNGNGDHSLSVADLDGDGKQEIIYGAMAVDDNGQILHNTTLGHGDALHVGDLDPAKPGIEIFNIQERVDNQGANFRNGLTGEIYWAYPTSAGSDEGPGRGMAADVDPDNPGAECWVAGGGISGIISAATGQVLNITTSGGNNFSTNFRIYWDDDLYEELLDSNRVQKLNYNASPKAWTRQLTGNGSSINGTKATPCLSADLFGDWREEIVWSAGNVALNIYTTTIPTTHRIVTLMHDPQYRVAVAWQNTAYNQPPHPSFNPVFSPAPTAPFTGPVRIWNGATGDTTWNDSVATNWVDTLGAASFAEGDAVLFTDAAANTTVSLSGNLAPSSLTVLATKNYSFNGSGNLTGNTALVKSGTGILTMFAGGNFSGGTNITSGTLALGGNSTGAQNPAFLGTGPIRVTNAELRLGGSSVAGTVYDIPQNFILGVEAVVRGVNSRQNLNGNISVIGGGPANITTSTSGQHVYLNGVLSGSGPLTLSGSGSGAVHLTNGNNTYTGNINVTSVSVDHATALKTARVFMTGTPVFTVPSAEFGSIQGTSNLALPTGSLTVGDNNVSTSYNGVISSSGGFIKTGSGNLTLVGNNTTSTFTGPVTVNEGTLTAIHAVTTTYTGNVTTNGTTITALSGTANITIGQFVTGTGIPGNTTVTGLNVANGTVTLSAAATGNGTGANYTFRSSRGIGNTTSAIANGGTLNFGASTTTIIGTVALVTGNIAGTGLISPTFTVVESGTLSANLGGGGTLTKNGAGTVTLSGNNTRTGATTINSGTLSLSNNNTIASASAVTVASGAVLNMSNRTMTFASLAGGGNVTLGNGTLTAGGSNTSTTFSGNISGTGGFVKTGSGTTIFDGTNTYTGVTTVNSGILQIGSGGAAGAIAGNVTNNATLRFARSSIATFAPVISGPGVLVQQGPAMLVLTGNNTYTGGTNITGGTLQIGSGAAGGAVGTGPVANNGTLIFNRSGASHTFDIPITGNGGVTKFNTGVLILTADNTYSGTTLVSSGTLQIGSGGTGGTIGGGEVSLLGGNIAVNRTGTFTLAGAISGNGSLSKLGAGILVLGADNTFTGATTISAGTLQVGEGGVTGTLGTGNVTNNGMLIFNRAGALTQSGSISGSGSIEKLGEGVLTLAGNHTFAGTATVTAGTLIIEGGVTNLIGDVKSGAVIDVTGQLFLNTLFIRSGAKLRGTGTITGNVIIEDGGLLEGVSGPGTGLTIAGNLSNSGVVRLTGGTGLTVTGTLENTATGVLDSLTGAAPSAGVLANDGTAFGSEALRVGEIAASNGSGAIQLSIQSYPGHDYQLQCAESLGAPWQDLGPAQAGNGSVLVFEDSTGPTTGRKFYRIAVSP